MTEPGPTTIAQLVADAYAEQHLDSGVFDLVDPATIASRVRPLGVYHPEALARAVRLAITFDPIDGPAAWRAALSAGHRRGRVDLGEAGVVVANLVTDHNPGLLASTAGEAMAMRSMIYLALAVIDEDVTPLAAALESCLALAVTASAQRRRR